MNRVLAKRAIASTLAFGCVFCGLYIGSAGNAAAAVASGLRSGLSKTAEAAALAAPNENRPEPGRKGHRPEQETPPIVNEAAAVLGMNAAALAEQLKGGKSLAEVARERGLSEQDLTAKLLQLRVTRIDEAVKKGKLDAARAEYMKQRMGQHLSYMVKEKGLLHKETLHKEFGWKPNREQLASVLGLSQDELSKQLKTGKSVAEIAAAKGISREQLIAKLKEQLTPQLERWVDRKHPAAGEK